MKALLILAGAGAIAAFAADWALDKLVAEGVIKAPSERALTAATGATIAVAAHYLAKKVG